MIKTLYKYQDWSNQYHRKSFLSSEVYFSNNFKFNDIYDLNCPFKFEGTFKYSDEEIIEDVYKPLRIIPNQKQIEEARASLIEHQNSETFKREFVEFMQKEVKKNTDNTGVFCLSQNPNSTLMWGHYSNSHKGYCLGFDSRKLIKFLKSKYGNKLNDYVVNYVDKFPVFDINGFSIEDFKTSFAKEYLSYKFQQWEYEEEVRFLISGITNQAVKIDPNIVKEVIFGNKISELDLETIKIICQSRFQHIQLYKAEMHKEKFEMELIPFR